jgi:GTP-binding protein
MVMEAGRALVIAINKWDNLPLEKKEEVKQELNLKLPFIDFARIHYISALHGTGVGDLYGSVNRAYLSAMRKLSTPELTNLLESLQLTHQPPMINGRRIKLRYAHQGGKNPPLIILHGNQVDEIPKSYKRYLEKGFRKYLKLEGTPIRIEFKGGVNPYAERQSEAGKRQPVNKNRLLELTKRQKRKGKK